MVVVGRLRSLKNPFTMSYTTNAWSETTSLALYILIMSHPPIRQSRSHRAWIHNLVNVFISNFLRRKISALSNKLQQKGTQIYITNSFISIYYSAIFIEHLMYLRVPIQVGSSWFSVLWFLSNAVFTSLRIKIISFYVSTYDVPFREYYFLGFIINRIYVMSHFFPRDIFSILIIYF